MNTKQNYIILTTVMLAIILTAITAVAGMYYIDSTSSKLRETASQYDIKNQLVIKLWDTVRNRTISLKSMLMETDPFRRDDYHIEHLRLGEIFVITHEQLLSMEHNADEYALMKELGRRLNEAGTIQQSLVEMAIDDNLEAALSRMSTYEYIDSREKFTEHFKGILAYYQNKTNEAVNEVNTIVLRNINFVLILTAIVLMMSASVGLFMMRKISSAEKVIRKEVKRHVKTQKKLELHRQHLEDNVERGIAKYKQADAERRKSQEMAYATGRILEDSLNEILIFDAKTLLFFQVNKAARKNIGYTMEELKGMTPADLSPNLNLDEINKTIQPLVSGMTKILDFTGYMQRKDKTSYPVEVHVQMVMMDSVPMIVAMARDITLRREAEDSMLRKTEELSRAENQIEYQKKAMDEHAIVSVFDQRERLIYVNQKFIDISGYSKEYLLGKKLLDTISDVKCSALFADISDDIQRGKVWHGELCNYRADGTPYWTKTSITPFIGTNGDIEKFISISTDFTAQKLAENDLRKKTAEVEQAHKDLEASHNQALQAEKLASVGQLAAGIAHEINTPIQFVGDNVRFLQDVIEDLSELIELYEDHCKACIEGNADKALAEKAREKSDELDVEYLLEEAPSAIKQSLDGIERVTKIVRSMKDFSHPGSNEREIIDINQAIDSTRTVCRNEWKYVAELVTDFDASLVAVPCYAGELNQVVLNIIVNAAHAIQDSRCEDDPLGTITIKTAQLENFAEIRISDNGTGMPEDVRKRIFEPFYTTKCVGKGTGQGLAIAYSVIVDKHHGTIQVESEVGKGTTFIICLPLDADDKLTNAA